MIKKIMVQSAGVFCGVFLSTLIYAETLSEVVNKALRFNPDVLFNTVHQHTTSEQVNEAKADFLPSIDLDAGYGAEKATNPTALAFAPSNPALDRQEAGGRVTQHLFTGGHLTNEWKRNLSNLRSATYKISGVANDVALDATEQHINILKRQALIQLADQTLSKILSINGMITKRTKKGVGSKADTEQADARVALAQTNLTTEKSNYQDAVIRFVKIVGSYPHDLARPTTPTVPWLPASLEQGVSEGVAKHPTLKVAWADVDGARYQHLSSKSLNYPQVDLVLAIRRDRNLDGIPGKNWDDLAVFRATYNIFKGGGDLARQKETAFKIREALEVKDKTITQIRETLGLSWNALKATQDRIVYLQEHVNSSQTLVGSYEEQFKLGQRTLLDVLDSENEYYQAKFDLISAEYDELFARYRILNATGKLLNYLCVTLPPEAVVTYN